MHYNSPQQEKEGALRKKLVLVFLLFFSLLPFLPPHTLYAETVQADLNNDGVQDLKAFFNSDTLSRTELDRNGDGQADVWMLFSGTSGAWDTRADYDENYDGGVDQIFFIKGDLPVRSLWDQNQDGLLEEEVIYEAGEAGQKRRLEPPLDPKKI